jgi:small-conductance mechanosensitive channel
MNFRHLTLFSTLQKFILSVALLGASFLGVISTIAFNAIDLAPAITNPPKNEYEVAIILVRAALLILLVGLYWLILNRLRKSLKTWIPNNHRIRIITDLTITIGTIFLSFLTITFAFVDNLSAFFTFLGLISTALIFTLQDFIASLFGWFQIKMANLYMTGDEITLHTGTTKYTGKVVHTGIFRTLIKVRRGDETLNSEQFTGKVVSFPNHLVLKDGLDNSTKTNRVLWHHFATTVTFESDAHLAKSILQSIVDKQFQYSLDHDQVSNQSQAKKLVYKPKIFLDISSEGNRFTIWFACNIEFYREIVNNYSFEILDKFALNEIKLAYPTHRIVLDKK